MPYLSVVMSVYNGEKHLNEAIDSILSQTYENFEFIIIEDCSTDNSLDILEEYAKKDSRIKIIKKEKDIGIKGFIENLNLGISIAKGKYIARMDQVDVSLPERFQKQVDFLEKNGYFTICHHRVKLNINGTEELHKYHVSKNTPIKQTLEDITKYNFIYTCSVVFRNIPVNMPDWYKFLPIGDYTLWLFLAKNGNIYYMPDIMGVYRIGSGVFSTETNISKLQTTNVALHFYKKIFPYCSIYYKNLDFQEKQNIRTISKYYLYNTVHKEKNIKDYISYKTIYKLILLKLNFLK